MKAIFISVRTGSSRLPNKSILKIRNKYTIEYVIDSVKKSKYADKIVLCTTRKSEDDILCEIAKKNDIKYYRGSEENKFKRWYWAALEHNVTFFVTADGDDLFYDSELADICFERGDGYEFVDGQGLYNDTYGFRLSTIENIIEKSNGQIVEPHEVSTITSDIGLNTLVLSDVPDMLKKKNIRMTLDYQEDFDFFKTVIENLDESFDLKDVLSYVDNNKSVIDINYFREQDWENNQGIKS